MRRQSGKRKAPLDRCDVAEDVLDMLLWPVKAGGKRQQLAGFWEGSAGVNRFLLPPLQIDRPTTKFSLTLSVTTLDFSSP